MLLAIEIGLVIFATLAAGGYLIVKSDQKSTRESKLNQALAIPVPSVHEQLALKYHCSMTEDEVNQFNKAEWR